MQNLDFKNTNLFPGALILKLLKRLYPHQRVEICSSKEVEDNMITNFLKQLQLKIKLQRTCHNSISQQAKLHICSMSARVVSFPLRLAYLNAAFRWMLMAYGF